MRLSRKILFVAPALAVLGAVLLGTLGAGGQERRLVDLELSMTNRIAGESGEGVFVVSVRNNSDVTVRDIKVRLEVEDLTLGRSVDLTEAYTFFGDTNDGILDTDTLEWTIPQLRSASTAATKLELDIFNASATGQSLVRLQGSIVESTPRETPGRLGNNQARHYIQWEVDVDNYVYLANSLSSINVSYGVDADPGTDTFTVKVTNPAHNPYPYGFDHSVTQYQLRFKVTPSEGLQYTATPAAGTTFDTARGIWDIGTLVAGSLPAGNKQLDIRVTGRGARAGPAEDQCLTVEIEHVIPDPEVPWLPITACMEHRAMITGGFVGLFAWHDCVAESAYPCDGQPSLELAASKSARKFFVESPTDAYAVADVHGGRFRSDDLSYALNDNLDYILTNNMVLQPEETVLQVPDNYATRITESGNTVWSTAKLFTLFVDQSDFDSSWSGFKESVTVTGADGAASPGRWRMSSGSVDILDAPDSTKVEGTPYSFNDIVAGGQAVFGIEFAALGTYVVLYEIEATIFGTTYTDSGTYTFHVGPVSELEVRDDPAYSLAEPGRRAYTILARNHGPDTTPAVDVTLSGVPEGAKTVASQGIYTQGACGENGLCEGVWSVGEMLDTASRVARGQTEGEVLTIIPPGSGGDPITAVIENARDYSVVIEGTTHTTGYYDYLDHNNEAEIALRPTPRQGPPGRPERPTVTRIPSAGQRFPSFALVQWQPVEELNGFKVTRYEVQRAASAWETIAGDVGGTMYVDMDVRPGQLMRYRVRAVNEAGGYGPWSLPMLTGPDAPGDFVAEQLRDGEVRLTWSKPDGNGAEVTGFTLQVSTNGGESWASAGARLGAGDTSWVHSNLSVGPARLYRIRAGTAHGPGPWAQATSAEVGTPVLTADYFDGPSRIELSWTMPEGNAVPVLSWELQQSPDGSAWSRLATVRAEDGMSYTHSGLSPGALRHYRIRAGTALGHGPWSETAAATTAAGVPAGFRAVANGPNEVVLSWTAPSGDAEVFEWEVQRSTEGVDWVRVATVYPEQGTRYVDGGLAAGGTWSYRVRAFSIAGGSMLWGDWSAARTVTTDSGGPDNPPAGLVATPGENRVDLSWTAPAAGGGAVTGYRVEHSTGDAGTWERVASLGDTLAYSDTGLLSGTTHRYRVAAVGGGSAGPFSNVASATTTGTPTTAPGIPTNLRVTGAEPNRVSIAWDPPADDGGTRVTGYEYQHFGPCPADPASVCPGDVKSTNATSVTVGGLRTAGEYHFDVRAINAVGAGEWSDPVWARVAPQARGKVSVTPTGLTLTEGGSATYRIKLSTNPSQPIQVGLFWDDPDNILSPALAGYQGFILLPSNYPTPADGMWDGWAYPWNVGIPITVEAVEDDDTQDGTAIIHHDVWTAPADVLDNPQNWAPDPAYHHISGPAVKVTVRDND